jgi:hypothetical protein
MSKRRKRWEVNRAARRLARGEGPQDENDGEETGAPVELRTDRDRRKRQRRRIKEVAKKEVKATAKAKALATGQKDRQPIEVPKNKKKRRKAKTRSLPETEATPESEFPTPQDSDSELEYEAHPTRTSNRIAQPPRAYKRRRLSPEPNTDLVITPGHGPNSLPLSIAKPKRRNYGDGGRSVPLTAELLAACGIDAPPPQVESVQVRRERYAASLGRTVDHLGRIVGGATRALPVEPRARRGKMKPANEVNKGQEPCEKKADVQTYLPVVTDAVVPPGAVRSSVFSRVLRIMMGLPQTQPKPATVRTEAPPTRPPVWAEVSSDIWHEQ